MPTGSSGCFGARLENLALTEPLRSEVAPLLALQDPLNERIERLEEQLGELAAKDERAGSRRGQG